MNIEEVVGSKTISDKLMDSFMVFQRFTVIAELSAATGQYGAFYSAIDVVRERATELVELVDKRKKEIEMASKKNHTKKTVDAKIPQNNQGTKPNPKDGSTKGSNSDASQFKKSGSTKKKSKKRKGGRGC